MSFTVILTELLDNRIKKPGDVEDTMKISLLGVVPNLEKMK